MHIRTSAHLHIEGNLAHGLVEGNDGFVEAFAGNEELDVYLAQGETGALDIDAFGGQCSGGFGQQTRLVDIGADKANHGNGFDGYFFEKVFELADKLFVEVFFPDDDGYAVGAGGFEIVADAEVVEHLHDAEVGTYVANHQRVVNIDDKELGGAGYHFNALAVAHVVLSDKGARVLGFKGVFDAEVDVVDL